MDITSFLNQDNSFPVSIAGTSKVADNEVIGIGGFSMYATLENTKSLMSTAPDVTLEDGSVVSDTIFLTPVTISISGVVSDVFIRIDTPDNIFSQTQDVIGVMSQYLPSRTNSQLSKIAAITEDVKNVKRRINSVLEDGKRLQGAFGDNTGTKTLQEQFLDAVEQVHFSRALIDIESPYRVYKNMRITSLKTTETNESSGLSFVIEAKQIGLRKLKTVTVASIEPAPAPSQGLGGSTEQEIDKGTTSGAEVSEEKSKSLLTSILG